MNSLGQTFSQELDGARLEFLVERVRNFMLSGEWKTLAEIHAACGGTEASCSARLRQLRNEFKYSVEKRRRGNPRLGLWEYRLAYRKDERGNALLPGMNA